MAMWRALSFRILHFPGCRLTAKPPNTRLQCDQRCWTPETPSARRISLESLLVPGPTRGGDTRLAPRLSGIYTRIFTRSRSKSTHAAASNTIVKQQDSLQTSEPPLRHDPSSQYVALQLTPKLKPHIVKRRLKRMRVYEGAEKNIRHSPWRLNLVCQLAAGLPLPIALTQLEFCKKWAAPLVQKVLKRTANLADIRDGLQHSQLEVAECFATKGTPLKRMKIMGRGRTGLMEHKHSHMRVVLREIDFKLKVYQAPSINQKKRWLQLQQQAQRDGDRAKAEREELDRLEKQAESVAAAKE